MCRLVGNIMIYGFCYSLPNTWIRHSKRRRARSDVKGHFRPMEGKLINKTVLFITPYLIPNCKTSGTSVSQWLSIMRVTRVPSWYKWVVLTTTCISTFFALGYIVSTTSIVSLYYNIRYNETVVSNLIGPVQVGFTQIACKWINNIT